MKKCFCPEGQEIQSSLVDHVMSHFVLESTTVEVKMEVVSFVETRLVEMKQEPITWNDAPSESSYHDATDSDHSEEGSLSTSEETAMEPQESFVCDTCLFSTPDRDFLTIHWQSEHDPSNEFACSRRYCKSRFKSQKELELHQRVHKRKKSETEEDTLCHICSKCFPTVYRLNLHLRTHQSSSEKIFECDFCPLKFKSRQEVRQHILRHKRMSKQSGIRRLYPAEYHAKSAVKNPDELRPHKCHYEGCKRKFKLPSLLNDHISVHLGLKPYKCEYCSEEFRSKHALTKHHKDVHKDVKVNWCEVCQKEFSSPKHLQQHNDSRHSGNLPFACSYCEEHFRFKKQLVAHLEVHERKICEICFKSVLLQKYEIHKQKHSISIGDRPFKCDHPGCAGAFTSLLHLNDHKNTHSNLRPHICDICSEGFNYRSAMQRHRESHINPDK